VQSMKNNFFCYFASLLKQRPILKLVNVRQYLEIDYSLPLNSYLNLFIFSAPNYLPNLPKYGHRTLIQARREKWYPDRNIFLIHNLSTLSFGILAVHNKISEENLCNDEHFWCSCPNGNHTNINYVYCNVYHMSVQILSVTSYGFDIS
jgi:hypothetical protein